METVSYYQGAFKKLIEAGVPRWYIRDYLLTDLIYFSRVYVYRALSEDDEGDEGGWYSTTGISICSGSTRKGQYYGELRSKGFPTTDEYELLLEGSEDLREHLYSHHKKLWTMTVESQI